MAAARDLYANLGLTRNATDTEVKRAYRNLSTKLHPDKPGGDTVLFQHVQKAYEVLSDASKRRLYDSTGKVQKTVDEEFAAAFGGGQFKDRVRDGSDSQAVRMGMGGVDALAQLGLADQMITRHASGDMTSHTAGFEAWMRSRGGADNGSVLTREAIAEQFGVVRSSYDAVPLAEQDAFCVQCTRAGPPQEMLSLSSGPLARELEWGQVLVEMRYAAINPADLYSCRMGGIYGSNTAEPPYAAGHDGVGVVTKVGPGVKGLCEGDVVLPGRTFLGTWCSSLVAKEKDWIKVPAQLMSLEHLALSREMCVAYRLLEDHGDLKPGDCVILNAANSTVGQILLQIAALLRLRVIAVVRDTGRADWDSFSAWLKKLGAAEVLKDEGSLKLELDRAKFFSRPKLALDSVGGESGLRLADALAEGGEVVIYGCMSGKVPAWPWQAWVFKGMKVSGFSLSRWLQGNKSKLVGVLEALSKLLNADKLKVNYTEYDLVTEFGEALEHSMDHGKNTKVLLRCSNAANVLNS